MLRINLRTKLHCTYTKYHPEKLDNYVICITMSRKGLQKINRQKLGK